MRRGGITAIGIACAFALAAAGCGESSSSRSGDGEIKLGLLTSLSGPASSAFKTTKLGIDARLAAYRDDKGKCADRKISVVQADDTSSAQGALTATQKLIQHDKVYTLLDASQLFYGAAPYATGAGKKTPVIGGGSDGAKQWDSTDNNLFPALPVPAFDKVYTTMGLYFKGVGGTKIAGLSFASPSAAGSLEANLKSAEAAGLTRVYTNKSIPLGSTDVGAIVLGIIHSQADVVTMSLNPDTAFAVVAGLKQAGYQTKATLTATGYGADLLESAPAVQTAQGVSFPVGWQPVELKTPATEKLSKYLKKAGVASGIPGFNQTLGWLMTDLFLHALDKAGCGASQAKLISTLRHDKTWNANGLYHFTFDFSKAHQDEQCLYFLRLRGRAFVPEPGKTPVCGTVVT